MIVYRIFLQVAYSLPCLFAGDRGLLSRVTLELGEPLLVMQVGYPVRISLELASLTMGNKMSCILHARHTTFKLQDRRP